MSAARQAGGGDAFILDAFWRQNADLIIELPVMRRIFVAALLDADRPFTPDTMDQLRAAVGEPGLPSLAIIMDEVQHITAEVKASTLPTASATVLEAGRYFATNWYDWSNSNSKFQRISAASAHADRDVKLPDGESHRLRIVEPLDPRDREALQAEPDSPAFVHDTAARRYVNDIAGTVLRKLVQCAKLLPPNSAPSKAQLQTLWRRMWNDMCIDCERWLGSLPETERFKAAREVMPLISGQLQWGSAKVLYDTGIVFRSAASEFVRPISLAATAVLLRVTSAYHAATAPRLSSITDGRERGIRIGAPTSGQG